VDPVSAGEVLKGFDEWFLAHLAECGVSLLRGRANLPFS
jgi:hypothetical protein